MGQARPGRPGRPGRCWRRPGPGPGPAAPERRRWPGRRTASSPMGTRMDRGGSSAAAASGERGWPRNTTPNTLAKQATARAPIMARAAQQRQRTRRSGRRPPAEGAQIDQQFADEAVERRQPADGRGAEPGRPAVHGMGLARPPSASDLGCRWRAGPSRRPGTAGP